MATDKKKRGQPTKYEARVHVPWAVSLAQRGCTTAEIADAFEVSERTVYRWMAAHAEFRQAVNDSKSRADEAVVATLYARAMGTTKRTTKRKREVLGNDGKKVLLTEVIEETPAPDTAACIFWLKNRQPKLWRDHPDEGGAAATDEAIKAAISKAGLR